MKEADLVQFASTCRNAMEGWATRSGSMFHRFPIGACGDATNLIGRLLKEHFGLNGEYVCGEQHPTLASGNHAWYEAAGYIIDITHDQFEDTGLVGWVFPLSSTWHTSFGEIERSTYCEGWFGYPYDAYAAMLAALEAR
ncbi:hypothetical protein FNU76_02430 [Chitinimonas arctica]|uniref:Uncharacterized protein n=1 Tax=Chitinimonas arctica TaxID=2594795 RepID=A0A516SAX3_9NEIS|nr:hypothetical protein [Chitinimonas arctica]QDQ25300.1 hypothetical protein FNU76_02430 [Chitinimonas arctica]